MKRIEKIKEWLEKAAKRQLWDSDSKDLAAECASNFGMGGTPPDWLVELATKAIDKAINEESAHNNEYHSMYDLFEELIPAPPLRNPDEPSCYDIEDGY